MRSFLSQSSSEKICNSCHSHLFVKMNCSHQYLKNTSCHDPAVSHHFSWRQGCWRSSDLTESFLPRVSRVRKVQTEYAFMTINQESWLISSSTCFRTMKQIQVQNEFLIQYQLFCCVDLLILFSNFILWMKERELKSHCRV